MGPTRKREPPDKWPRPSGRNLNFDGNAFAPALGSDAPHLCSLYKIPSPARPTWDGFSTHEIQPVGLPSGTGGYWLLFARHGSRCFGMKREPPDEWPHPSGRNLNFDGNTFTCVLDFNAPHLCSLHTKPASARSTWDGFSNLEIQPVGRPFETCGCWLLFVRHGSRCLGIVSARQDSQYGMASAFFKFNQLVFHIECANRSRTYHLGKQGYFSRIFI